MMQKDEIAIQTYKSGRNCAQSILSAFMNDYGINEETAMNFTSAFGSGMGRLRETCGAVTGAFMVIGFYTAEKYSDLKERRQKTYELVREFNQMFVSKQKSNNCKMILQNKYIADEAVDYGISNNCNMTPCESSIITSVKLLETLIV